MKLILTEQQLTNLLTNVGKNIGKGKMNANVSNTPNPFEGINLDIDFEKEAPNLMKLGRMFGSLYGIPSDINNTTQQTSEPKLTRDTESNDTNISLDNKPMHPLGSKKATISSPYGKRKSTVGASNHQGVDIATASGSLVYAPLDGVVIKAGDTYPDPCGGFIKIDHSQIITKFCHLRKISVKAGQKVKKGQVIGESGGGKKDPMHGRSTGPHLHYEIINKISGLSVNPTKIHNNLA